MARAGYAGHLVRDLSNTHVMIVGGGTLIATGIVLVRAAARSSVARWPATASPSARSGSRRSGCCVFYIALIANGIAMGRLVAHGWDYQAAKPHMGNWYRCRSGRGAGVMGVGYWCFAGERRCSRSSRRGSCACPSRAATWRSSSLTGALGLTVGTVQGVIQVQPKNADWL